ncbi:MAG: heme o synthase [Buchnera aphidicola (Schlechtendalia peitan)]
MILLFFELLKPKIVFGNILSSLGGFLLASRGNINYHLLFLNIIGISLVIGSSCILNNVIDCNIDKYMDRTKNRILVISSSFHNLAIFFAIVLGILGFSIYIYYINILCMLLSSIGWIVYVVLYSMYLKKRSIYSTLIGSISGSIPPLLGYCSVTNHVDLCVFNLFLIFITWQIPHSYAIFIMHFSDYKRVNIPIFPIVKSFLVTRYHIRIFILLFLLSTCLLVATNYVGYKFLFSILFLSVIWFYLSIKTYRSDYNHIIWAKNIFYHSIIIMFIMNIMMSFDYIN